MGVLLGILTLWLVPATSLSQYKVFAWYESWCERPLGQYYGIGAPPWLLNWQGVDVIVHFDNQNVNNNASPYWGYINKGNSGADSLYFFGGNMLDGYNYVDSLVNRGHAAGAKVVMEIMDINGDHIITIANDSTMSDVFCTAVAQWCERHNYDGVDVNWENAANFATQANGNRFIRILRRRLNQYLTSPVGLSRPWLSLTCPPDAYRSNAMFSVDIKDSVDMVCPQQGTEEWVWDGTCQSAVNWYGCAVQLGRSSYPYPQARGQWISTLQDDASWIPSNYTPTGIRAVNSYGWPKGKIAPAFSLGGGVIHKGSDTLFGCSSSYISDANRYTQKQLLLHGGTKYWDAAHSAEYVSGTATASMSFAYGTINSGEKFWAGTPDSMQAYAISRWCIDNGWGGVAPFSISFDVDASAGLNNRLPGHKGLIAAKAPVGPSAPTATTDPATAITQTTATLNGTVSANGSSTTVRFVYGTVSGQYTDSVVAAQSPVTGNVTVTGGLTGLTGSRTYFYRVRAYNALGRAQGNEVSFTTSAPPPSPPAPPTLASPANGATNVATNPTLTWNAPTGATSYHVQVSTSAGFTTILLDQSNIASPSYAASGLSSSTTYYWHVSASNAGGTSAYSTAWSFTTGVPPPPPAAPVPALPANGTTGVATSPTLTWNASSGATSYRVQVSTDAAFGTTVLDRGGVTTTSTVAASLAGNTRYYWHVSAINNGGASPYSSAWNFTTAPAPTGLLAGYAFDEGAGTTVTDASAHGLTGTISGATWTTQGRYANALSFDGSSSSVDLGNPPSLQMTGSMTVSAWVKASANPPDDGQIIAKSDDSNGWQLKTSPDTGPHTFGIAVSSNSTRVQRYSITAWSLNVWYHVAGVYNASAQTLDIYVNGVLDNGVLVGTIPASQSDAGVNVNVGCRSGGYYFNGLVDEVRVYNRALSQAEIQSDMNTPLTGQPLPPAPRCLAPFNGATGQQTSLVFRWNRVPSASGYHLQVSGDSLFASPVINDAQLTDTTRQVINLATATTYYWRVSSRSSTGEGAYSSVWSFRTLVAIPPAPVLLSPVDTAGNQPVVIPLSWTRCPQVISYQVQVASDSLFNALVVNDSTIVDSTRQVGTLAYHTRYFWRVRAKNSSGCGSYSPAWRFTTVSTIPAIPTLVSPVNGSNGLGTSLTLSWNPSTGATSYHVQVSTSSSFTTTVIDQSNISATSYAATGLSAGTTYYWHVSAMNGIGSSAYSSVWSFATVSGPPPPPVLATPVNGSTGVETNPTLTWNGSAGAVSYRVQVSATAGFTTTVVNQGGITTPSLAIGGLATNTTYYWHVNATNAAGTSAYSATFSFTTTALSPGRVASYAFSEGTGKTVADSSGNGLTGTIVGATWTPQGKYGNALVFNGTSSYVDLGNPALLSFTGSMTLSAWVNATANPADDGQIIAKSTGAGGWQLKTSPDTGPHTFAIAVSNSSGAHTQRYSRTIRALNTWYHVAGVYNASARTLDIYVNGVLDNGKLVGMIPASQVNATVNVNIGRRSGGYYFKGTIDEVHVYNRALSQPEIVTDMVSSSAGPLIAGVEVRKGGPFKVVWSGKKQSVASTPAAPAKGGGYTEQASDDGQTTVTVSVSGGGAPTYQWQRNGVDIPGANGPAYTIVAGDADRAVRLRCVVSSPVGSDTTSEATVSPETGVGVSGAGEMLSLTGEAPVPREFALHQNYPNPFNPSTVITFDLPVQSQVTLIVYNLLGQGVATLVDGVLDAGRQQVRFSGSHLADGVYFYVLKSGSFSQTRKMILLK